jgi:quercetin dioxygenase-like cupin family protein
VSARDPEADLLGDGLGAEPIAPSADLRGAVLASVAAGTKLAGFAERLAALFDFGAERAAELLREAGGDASGWQTLPLPGVRLFHFAGGPRAAGADCGLVRLEPGARFPLHRHGGDEWLLVLAGEAEEEGTGARWLPGDLVHRDAGSVHAYRVTSPEPFVFAVLLRDGIEIAEPPPSP